MADGFKIAQALNAIWTEITTDSEMPGAGLWHIDQLCKLDDHA